MHDLESVSVSLFQPRRALRPEAWDTFIGGIHDPVQRSAGLGQALCAVFDRQIGQVDIDRQALHVAVEHVDGGSAFEGEDRFVCDEGQQAPQ